MFKWLSHKLLQAYLPKRKKIKKKNEKEITIEIQTNQHKVEQHFKSKVVRINTRIDRVEFDNANILEKHT